MALVDIRNEYGKLLKVALYRPSIKDVYNGDPSDAFYVSRPDHAKVMKEFDGIVASLKSEGVEVIELHDNDSDIAYPNMIYLRDVATVIKDKIILSEMKHTVRKHEPKKFAKLLYESNPLYVSNIAPDIVTDSLEGADVLVIDSKSVCAYLGNRTSKIAVSEIAEYMDLDRVFILEANISSIPQHLLGGFHILNAQRASRRTEYCRDTLPGFEHLDFEESHEIKDGFAMNIITISPDIILMPSGNTNTRTHFESKGIKCIEVDVDEIHKMGGGLACMALPLLREAL